MAKRNRSEASKTACRPVFPGLAMDTCEGQHNLPSPNPVPMHDDTLNLVGIPRGISEVGTKYLLSCIEIRWPT